MGIGGFAGERARIEPTTQAIAAVPSSRSDPTRAGGSAEAQADRSGRARGLRQALPPLPRRRPPAPRSTSKQAPGPRPSGPSRNGSTSTTSASPSASIALRVEFEVDSLEIEAWQEAKLALHRAARRALPAGARRDVLQLGGHENPATPATTDNDLIFVRAAMSTEYIDSDPPIYRCYYPAAGSLRRSFEQVFLDFGWNCPFADLERDLGHLLRALDEPARSALGSTWSRTTRSRC